MNNFHRTILSAALCFALIQILPLKPRNNPAIHAGRTMEAQLDVPPPVRAILNSACKDCHSHETRWPWYARIAPVSWLIARDVERARHAMDLSDWTVRPMSAAGVLLAACTGVESQRMPPAAAYRATHPEARLSEEQADTLCSWTAAQARTLHHTAWRKP